MGDRIKVGLQVGIDYISVSLLEKQVHLSQSALQPRPGLNP
jgi:hypothetical protein